MKPNNHNTNLTQRRISTRWHIFLHAYAKLNRISHHLLSLSIKFLIVLFLLFCLLFLALRFFLIPQIGTYKPEIEHMLSLELGRTVRINQVVGSWQGLRPHLELQQVAIRDEQGKNALMLPNVQATVSWLSLLIANVRLYSLEISAPELELKRSVDGKIFIAGWWIDPAKKSDSRGINWILSQRSIVINDGTLKWTDLQRAAPVLTLSNVDFVMKNQWLHHQFSLTTNPPTELAGPLDIRADFKHRPFSENISDFSQWKGQLYANFPKTDLTAWKSYVDYPFEIQQGVGGARFWFVFDQGKVVDITADLKLTNVNARLEHNLKTLHLKSVSGRISAQEITIPTLVTKTDLSDGMPIAERFRQNGHQIVLTNFSFETQNGMLLPPTTLTERYIPANKRNNVNSAAQFQFSTKFLDLTVLAKLAEYFPMPKEYRELLSNVQPAGTISQFAVKLQGNYPEFSHYQITGGFSNLTMKAINPQQKESSPIPTGVASALSLVPGFTNLTGHIDVNDKKGSIQLESKNLVLQLSDAFSEPETKFDLIEMNANWALQPNNHLLLTLTKFNSTQQDMQAHFYGTHLFSTQHQDKNKTFLDQVLNGTIDITGTISHIDLNKIHRLLPPGTETDLRHWLTQGLLQGRLENASVRIKGNLAELPFAKKGILDQNIFHITGKINEGKINYLPGEFAKDGVNPYWPLLSKINGQIIFDRESMDINAESGETEGIPVTKVHARIPDLLSNNVMLEIDGTASGRAQDMLHYVSTSPVLGWIGNFTQDTKMTGSTKLKLSLKIPLSHPLNTVVAGEVQLSNNDVALLKDLPLLTQASGRFNFDERGIYLNNLKGNFLGGPIIVTGGTQKDDVIRIKAEGMVTSEGVQKAYALPELKSVMTHIDGKTPFTTTIQIKNKQTEIWVDSTMQGMALNLPIPFKKTASDKMPLHVEVINVASSANKGAHEYDVMKFSLGAAANAQYFRERESATSHWKVLRGGIGINAPAPTPESGLSAHVDLTSFNVDDIRALIPNRSSRLTNSTPKESIDNTVSTMNIYQYLEPDVLSVHATELILLGKKLNQVVLGATHTNGIWQANIDSKQISGYLTWKATEHGSGHVTARLGSLIIPETAANDVVDLLQDKKINSSIPGLDVIADNVELFGKKLGRLELQAKNVNAQNEPLRDSHINVWQIDSLSLTNADAVLTAKGKWTNSNSRNNSSPAKSQTDLNYQLAIVDAGKLLDRLGYPHIFAGGKGKLNGEVRWYGSPYSIDIPTLSGKIQLDLHTGQFLKVDPGAAKLLAVLNLQTLPRRLILDFRDVFSDGFAFDTITGNAEIENGVAKTDNFKMHSNSATVLLSGTVNITHETQDLHVIVVPELNATTASVLYGLAVNPLIGAGTFLAQLFLRHPLMKAFTFEYHITGSWKEPDVVKLGDKKKKAEK
jgi:uncharacterized protein (TIGR02099 family)